MVRESGSEKDMPCNTSRVVRVFWSYGGFGFSLYLYLFGFLWSRIWFIFNFVCVI
jgi:hypothetical protein